MIPNWTQEDIDSLNALSCAYIIYGKEIAPSTGMPHLQCFIMFESQKTLSAVNKLIRGHLTAVSTRPWDAAAYCKKDGDFTERGSFPKNPGKRERDDWDGYLDLIKRGCSDQLPAKLQITLSSHIGRLETKYRPAPATLDGELSHVWIWGAPGSGKSRKARTDYPGIYVKSHNKWWGGYKDEEAVLIDDIDPEWKGVGEHLRQWADRYPFPAEIKGGDLFIRPKTLVITCNYCLQSFCDRAGLSREHTEALMRRFTETYLVEQTE